MKRLLINLLMGIAVLLFQACADKGYNQSEVGARMMMEEGTVLSVRQVVLSNEGAGNFLGAIVGTVAGAIVGDHVGGGSGQEIATVLGGAIGGAVGGSIGDNLDVNHGQEVVVKLNNGQKIVTILAINETTPLLEVAQSVNVLSSSGKIASIVVR